MRSDDPDARFPHWASRSLAVLFAVVVTAGVVTLGVLLGALVDQFMSTALGSWQSDVTGWTVVAVLTVCEVDVIRQDYRRHRDGLS